MAGDSARERARQAREKAERLQRVAEAWERGADGESATGQTLADLPPGWIALHDLRWPGRRFANIDHLVIGPGGVFVVDSKNWSGRVQLDEGVLRQNGRVRETAVTGCADAARAVAGLVPMYAAMVHPVLCFVRDEELRGWSRDVIMCSTSTLVEMLLTRPVVLAPEGVEHLHRTLEASTQNATSPAPNPPSRTRSGAAHPAPRTKRPSRAQAQAARKRRKAVRELVVTLVGGLALIVWGPAIAETVAPRLTDLFISGVTPTPTACPTTKAASARPNTDCSTPTPKERVRKAPVRKPNNAGKQQASPKG